MKQEVQSKGTNGATDARILKTRVALARAVLALSEEKDFGEVTIPEIAARAGIGYATFYRHYPDKEALLAAVADPLIDELLAMMLPSLLQDDTRAAAIALCRFVEERRSVCRAVLAGGAAANVRQRLIDRATARQWPGDTHGRNGAPRGLIIVHAVTATLGLLASWLTMENPLSADSMGALMNRLVLAPIQELR